MSIIKKVIPLLALFGTQAWAAEHVLRWGINHDLDYFLKASDSFKQRVESRSKGKIRVEIQVINKPQEGYNHLVDVQNNVSDMSQELVFDLHREIPEFALWDLPYLFRDDAHYERFIDTPYAKGILKKMEIQGVVGLGYTYSGGFLHIFGTRINSFRDLKGVSFGLENHSSFYKDRMSKLLETSLTGLDHDAVKGTNKRASEIIIAVGKKELFPLAKQTKFFINTTDHRIVSRVLFVSKKFFDSLPGELQTIVLEEGKRFAKVERDITIHDKNVVLKEAKKHKIGMNIWSDEQKNREKLLFKSMYDEFIKNFSADPIKLVEKL